MLQVGHQWETYKEECDEADREIEQLKKKHHQEREKLTEESNALRVRFSTVINSLLMYIVCSGGRAKKAQRAVGFGDEAFWSRV